MNHNANNSHDIARHETQEPVSLSIEVMEERIAPFFFGRLSYSTSSWGSYSTAGSFGSYGFEADGISLNRCETLVDG